MPKRQLLALLLATLTGSPFAASAQATAGRPSLPMQEMRALAAAYDLLQTRFVASVESKALLVSAIRGMLRETDPEGGEYFTEDEWTEFRSGTRPGLGNVGIEIRRRNALQVIAPVEGGPAQAAGARLGDQLRAVDGKDVTGLDQHLVTRMLSGPSGKSVTLTLFRPSVGSLLEVQVVRQSFEAPGPSLQRVQQHWAVLRVPTFRTNSFKQSSELLQAAWRQHPFQGLVLDLRGNHGGLLEPALAMAATFLPDTSVIATASGRSEADRQIYRATPASYTKEGDRDPVADIPSQIRTLPMVVLVDEGTTAAAEIVAAALKDHRRATLVGRPTFGRGSIQTITPITGVGAVKYTTSYWTSPSGMSIHQNPIAPDVMVRIEESSTDLEKALAQLQRTK